MVDSGAEAKILKQKNNKTGLKYTIYKQRQLLLMLLPTLIVLAVFTYKPILSWVIAFKDYRIGKSVWKAEWTGFASFREFFMDSTDAVDVLRNTLVINIGALVINLTCALVFAILLNELKNKYFKSLVQTFSLFPFFISWVIGYSLILIFFSVNSGFVNMMLVKYEFIEEGINLLGDPKYSWVLMFGVNLWKSLGYNAIIFLAAIAGIDGQQYEAAEIDGAGRFAKIRHITLPSIVPTLVVLLILNSGMLLNSNFEQFYLFTNPTNVATMQVFDMYIYEFGLKLARFPYATAVSIVKTIVSILMLIIVNTLCKRLAGRSLF
ncbi:ABC transporter permease [Paenibacillus nasutitermitis]|uniref:Sugar ABC transporter permease n=1 Tax=Paenibacillus nasutitermitis TaxID=1652958 RepID=A0A916ZDJ9_9BACL|nr:ABC transporter permease subunit [Paenibacillus nasutitermitis]GGD88749.1 sugar ABC transporter permease [Paenibacillus nasutitermitis]